MKKNDFYINSLIPPKAYIGTLDHFPYIICLFDKINDFYATNFRQLLRQIFNFWLVQFK